METNTIATVTDLSEGLIEAYETFGYENRILSQREIAKMLDNHSAGRSWVDGKLMAGESPDGDLSDLTETTNWTLFDMLAFLGY